MNALAVMALPAPPPAPEPSVPFTPRTQKARGIVALSRHSGEYVPPFKVHNARDVNPDKLIGFFSRPCPVRPRHGFVDSRKVNSLQEGHALIRETLLADPEAEIVTMPLIEAALSGIWTTGLLTIGRGHDGATSGTSAWNLPALGNLVNGRVLTEAGVQGNPYVEILWPSGVENYRLVQLRDGPALPKTQDFIPHPIRVQHILHAAGDLLWWERKLQSAAPGTVVYHPGGSLASHYAIHAVLNQVPVLISREPEVGEFLEVETESEHKAADVEALRAGFYLASRLRISYEKAAYVMLAGCHHISVWTGNHDLLLGLALGFAYRLTVAAALGEMRHAPGASSREGIESRNDIYDACWEQTYSPAIHEAFEEALSVFHAHTWRRGFGGAKWFEFVRWAAIAQNELLDGKSAEALCALNQLVHCVHNNGWGFNKFLDDQMLTVTAQNPVEVLVECVPLLDRARRVLLGRERALAHWFERERTPLRVPKGEPNYDVDDDERREWYERRPDEPLVRRYSRRIRDRVGRVVARRRAPMEDIRF